MLYARNSMRDRKNRRVAGATRLRLKRRKQKRYGRVQMRLGIIFFLCVGILLLLFIRQLRDDAGQRQVIQEIFNKAYELQKQAQTEPVMLPEYAALYEQNSDIIGWLRIEGTVLFPVPG